MSSHSAMSFADVKVGGISIGGSNHVAGLIDNAIVWVGGDIIEELVNSQRCSFSGGCLFDDNRADDNQDLVIHSLSIKNKGTNDALDAFDADVVKRRT